MPQGEDLRQLIHDIADELRQRDDVQTIATQMASMAGTSEDPIAISPGIGFPALVDHMRQGGRPTGEPWKSQRFYQVGDTKVHERQGPGSQYNALVSLGRDSQYPQISALTINKIKQDAGVTDAQLAVAVRDSLQGKPLPEQLQKHASKLDRLKFLLFGREAIRNPGLVAFTPMTLDLIANPRDPMTWHEALAGHEDNAQRVGKRGAFPMSMEQAQSAAAELELERRETQADGQMLPTFHRGEQAEELAKREIELATRWLSAIMQAEGLKDFNSREQAKVLITAKILEFYQGRQRARKS
jgi:hypothetical protein